jgi:hypothetical protein
LEKLDFRDEDPEVIDLTSEKGVVDSLKECKIDCLVKEKVQSGCSSSLAFLLTGFA